MKPRAQSCFWNQKDGPGPAFQTSRCVPTLGRLSWSVPASLPPAQQTEQRTSHRLVPAASTYVRIARAPLLSPRKQHHAARPPPISLRRAAHADPGERPTAPPRVPCPACRLRTDGPAPSSHGRTVPRGGRTARGGWPALPHTSHIAVTTPRATTSFTSIHLIGPLLETPARRAPGLAGPVPPPHPGGEGNYTPVRPSRLPPITHLPQDNLLTASQPSARS